MTTIPRTPVSAARRALVRWLHRRPAPAALLILSAAVAPLPTSAQTYEGDLLAQLGGGALGFYSGGMLGLVGTMMP